MNKRMKYKLFMVGLAAGLLTMCTPPETADAGMDAAEEARRDSLREIRCPRLFSSAAEYYKNRDWSATVRIYNELVDLGCDKDDPQEVYLYYAIAFEYMGQYDSSEYVLLKGLQILPENIDLRKRLVYSYQKQGKIHEQINELDRLSYMAPDDLENKIDLAKLYGKEERFSDQIIVLKEILKIDPANEIAQGDLARAYELSGLDPLDVYRNRWENNTDNVSYGLDYADRLMTAERPHEAIDVLKLVLAADPTSKLAYRKLADTYDTVDRLSDAAETYERLFKLDSRDFRVAVKISAIYVDNQDYGSAYNWADKATTLFNEGEAFGAKGNVYYKAFQVCRTADISLNDRIVATLAYKYFEIAEEKGFLRFSRSKNWLKENEVLFGKAQWFMLDDEKKNKGYVKAESDCYNWVVERLDKDRQW